MNRSRPVVNTFLAAIYSSPIFLGSTRPTSSSRSTINSSSNKARNDIFATSWINQFSSISFLVYFIRFVCLPNDYYNREHYKNSRSKLFELCSDVLHELSYLNNFYYIIDFKINHYVPEAFKVLIYVFLL